MRFDRTLLRASFVLFGLSLLTGMLIPFFRNPRLALSTHLTGLLNVFVLTALAVVFPKLAGYRRAKLIRALFLICAFTMWFGGVLASAWGTTFVTPRASAGIKGTVLQASMSQEVVITAMTLVTVLLYIVVAAVVVWRLRPRYQ